jgi:DNA-directed RNA polymerase subunit RPC12/RpoP
MPDVLADGRFGEDHGIKCDECGSASFLIDDQGGGYMAYQCEKCDRSFSVQYDFDDEDGYEPDGWEIALWEEEHGY